MNTTDGFAAVDRNYPVVSFEEVQLIIGSGEPLRIIDQLSKFTNL